MKKQPLVFPLIALLSACNTPGIIKSENGASTPATMAQTSMSKTGYHPRPSSELVFNNDAPAPNFDQDLSKSMGQNYDGPITVAMTTVVEPDKGKMPHQLSKWLTVIQESGGKVDYEAIEEEMGVMTALTVISAGFKAYKFVNEWYEEYQKQQSIHKVAENYDARLCYQRDDPSSVTKIVFIDRHKRNSKQAVCAD